MTPNLLQRSPQRADISGQVPESLRNEFNVFLQLNPQWTKDEAIAAAITLLVLSSPEALEATKRYIDAVTDTPKPYGEAEEPEYQSVHQMDWQSELDFFETDGNAVMSEEVES